MITVGTEHRNPVSGETLRFLRVDHDRVTVEICAFPGFPVPPRHVHPRSAERFEVLDGALSINAGSARRILKVGDAMTAAAGVPHGYAVVGSSPARFLVDLAPPGEMASFFSRIYRLAETGPVNRRGQPPLLSVAEVAADHADDVRIPGVPAPVQRVLLTTLARVGRIRPAHTL